MFIDRVNALCIAGDGGPGVIAWRREKYIPKGGPAGGNGGKGGSIIFQADHNVYSLDWFAYKHTVRAEDGKAGGSACKQGRNGQDLIVKIPAGTLLTDGETQELLYDFTKDGEAFTVCKGGRGGKGNHAFRTSTNRAPNIATKGTPGETRQIQLELRLIADVGLVGFPNAGKSRLLQQLSRANVKVGAYPFTTLQPNLGYVSIDELHSICIADIPGIIEGAHQNRGLGLDFLRHIERTKVLLYVIDIAGYDGRNPCDDFSALQHELKAYDSSLLDKPMLIALNKCDLAEEAAPHIAAFTEVFPRYTQVTHVISAETGQGCRELVLSLLSLTGQQG